MVVACCFGESQQDFMIVWRKDGELVVFEYFELSNDNTAEGHNVLVRARCK